MLAARSFTPSLAALLLGLPAAVSAACLHGGLPVVCPVNPATMQPIPDGSESFSQTATSTCWVFPMKSGSACTPGITFTPAQPSSPPSGTPPQAPVVPPTPPAMVAPATAALIASTLPTQVRGVLALSDPVAIESPLPTYRRGRELTAEQWKEIEERQRRGEHVQVSAFIFAAPFHELNPAAKDFWAPDNEARLQMQRELARQADAMMARRAAAGQLGTSESERRYAIELERAMTERDRGGTLTAEQKTLLDEFDKAKTEAAGRTVTSLQIQTGALAEGPASNPAFPGWTHTQEPQGESASELIGFVFEDLFDAQRMEEIIRARDYGHTGMSDEWHFRQRYWATAERLRREGRLNEQEEKLLAEGSLSVHNVITAMGQLPVPVASEPRGDAAKPAATSEVATGPQLQDFRSTDRRWRDEQARRLKIEIENGGSGQGHASLFYLDLPTWEPVVTTIADGTTVVTIKERAVADPADGFTINVHGLTPGEQLKSIGVQGGELKFAVVAPNAESDRPLSLYVRSGLTAGLDLEGESTAAADEKSLTIRLTDMTRLAVPSYVISPMTSPREVDHLLAARAIVDGLLGDSSSYLRAKDEFARASPEVKEIVNRYVNTSSAPYMATGVPPPWRAQSESRAATSAASAAPSGRQLQQEAARQIIRDLSGSDPARQKRGKEAFDFASPEVKLIVANHFSRVALSVMQTAADAANAALAAAGGLSFQLSSGMTR